MSNDHSLLPKMDPKLLGDLRRYLDSPISWQRWRRYQDEIITELYERADQSGSTAEEELLLAASTAAWIAFTRRARYRTPSGRGLTPNPSSARPSLAE